MSLPDRPHAAAADPAARPRTLAQRLQLLCILLLVPAVAVTLPTLVVTRIFGQRPKPKALVDVKPPPPPDTSGLKDALNHSAETMFPTPPPLSPDTIQLKVRADHADARAKKVAGQALALGGAAVEGVVAVGEDKHLFVDLPAGRAEAFRRAVTNNEPPLVPVETPLPGSARDQLEVVIRAAADDE